MATILVADDNSNIQKMVTLAFKDQGIEVISVGNGEAAVRKLPDLRPDLVLADVFMPVRSGYEVCEYVKTDSRFAHIPVILLVGAFDPVDEREARRVGADGVLKKPFVPPDPLIAMVKSVLARSASEHLVSAAPPEDTAEAALAPAPVATAAPPEPEEEPSPEEMLAPTPLRFRIDEADKPVAFGELLDTRGAETEEIESLSGEPILRESIFKPAEEAAEEAAQELPSFEEEIADEILPRREEGAVFRTAEPESDAEAEIVPYPSEADAPQVKGSPPANLSGDANEWPEAAIVHPAPPLPAESGSPWDNTPPPEAEVEAAPEAKSADVAEAFEEPAELLASPAELPEPVEEPAPRAEVQPQPEVPVAAVEAIELPPPSPELIQAAVERVLERLQPQIVEIITREMLKPVVEALVRRELEKQ